VLDPELFPHDTVWSFFGRGYGFVPLVLPVLGILWLRRQGRATQAAGGTGAEGAGAGGSPRDPGTTR